MSNKTPEIISLNLMEQPHFFETLKSDIEESIKEYEAIEILSQSTIAEMVKARIANVVEYLTDALEGIEKSVLPKRDIWKALGVGKLLAKDGFLLFSDRQMFPKTFQYLEQDISSFETFKLIVSDNPDSY